MKVEIKLVNTDLKQIRGWTNYNQQTSVLKNLNSTFFIPTWNLNECGL